MRSTDRTTPATGPLMLFVVTVAAIVGAAFYYSRLSPESGLASINDAIARGDYSAAEELLAEVCESSPDDLEAINLLADICKKRGDLMAAIHWLESAECGSDTEPFCRVLLRAAANCIEEGLPGRARTALSRIWAADSKFVSGRQLSIRLHGLVWDQPGIMEDVAHLDKSGLATTNDILQYFQGPG